jgi:sterol desaturase/sphingolipid hydroxylase (fatty acid hydroxylase superfamily)
LPLLVIIVVALFIERVRPAQTQPPKAARFNLVYTVLYVVAQVMIVPIVSVATVSTINASGGGWIVLPTTGWALLPAFVLYALTLDFLEYLFHRAQHRVPVLWAMHSLHHSDATLNASTTSRHYWGEPGIKMVTIYLLAGMLFKANVFILGMYALLSFHNVFSHMNLRLGFGRWSTLINSPQYHRLHHSALPEHHNCNFAALFPVFDVMSGAYRRPHKSEYPPTGLDSGELPSGLVDAIFWPIHGPLLQRLFGAKT